MTGKLFTKLLMILGLGAALACAQGPSVEARADHLQRRIADDIAAHRITPHDASKLEHAMDKVFHRIADTRHAHGGVIPRHDWVKLERDLDRVEGRLREAEVYARRCGDCRAEHPHGRGW